MSVLKTQEPVHRLQHQLHIAELRVERLKDRLAKAVEVHRAQIKASLLSNNTEEREAAERIAKWWEVETNR